MSASNLLSEDTTLEHVMLRVAEESRPEQRMSVTEAAERYIFINQPGSYVGQFDGNYTPYMREPTDTLASREFTGMFFCGPIQTGKTQLVQSWLAHTVKVEPSDLMIVTMTQTAATDFAVSRIDRLNRNNPEIGKMLLTGASSDSMFRKMYRNGVIVSLSWPSPTELASKSIARVFLTDYDRMPQDVAKEGSPFDLAEKRTTTFRRNAMAVAESTPSFPVTDPMWSQHPDRPHEAPPTQGILGLYNRGDRRRWLWRCVECHTAFEPDFGRMKWHDTRDRMEASETCWMECPACAHKYTQSGDEFTPGKNDMNLLHAKWIREGQIWRQSGLIEGTPLRSRYASFWMKGPAARFLSWDKMVFDYLSALDHFERTQDETMLQTVVNTQHALPYRAHKLVSMRTPEQIKSKAYDLGAKVVPDGVRFLIATIDVQKSKFVVQVHGIGEGNDKWIIDRFNIRVSNRDDEEAGGKMWVNPGTYAEDWNLIISKVLLRSYELSDGSGRRMPIKLTLCDSGGQEGVTKNAYDFWRRLRKPPKPEDDKPETLEEFPPGLHNRFQLLIGRPSPGAPRYQITFPDAQRKDRHAGARGDVPVARLNSNMLKDELDNALDRQTPRGGRINFPLWLEQDFYNELCSEARNPKGEWERAGTWRNESWDLLTYCIAACLDAKIGSERPDFWISPPRWAAPWDENDFIFDPNEGKSMVAGPRNRPKIDFNKLGEDFG